MNKVKKYSDLKFWEDKTRCPICNSKLQKKHEGMACVNSCPLLFKCGEGWIYIKSKHDGLIWTLKYDFDINRHENIKKWLMVKSQLLYEKKMCEICKNKRRLHVHHIFARSSNPELTFDKENLMVLCESCHKKMHYNDKYSFWRENSR